MQDNDSHWYWIPESILDRFNELSLKTEGKYYIDCPAYFDQFSDLFEDYRTFGDPDNMPPKFSNADQVVFI